MSWNNTHNGNRVEGSDSESHEVFKEIDGTKIDGSIEDAIDATAQINGLGVLAKQSNTNSMFASPKIIRDMLKNRGVQPTASDDFDLYPTVELELYFDDTDDIEIAELPVTGGQTYYFIAKYLHFKARLNYKVNFPIKIPFQFTSINRVSGGRTSSPQIQTGTIEFSAGDSSTVVLLNDVRLISRGTGDVSLEITLRDTQYMDEGYQLDCKQLPLYLKNASDFVTFKNITIFDIAVDDTTAVVKPSKTFYSYAGTSTALETCPYSSNIVTLKQWADNYWYLSTSKANGRFFANNVDIMKGIVKYENGTATKSIVPFLDFQSGNWEMSDGTIVTCSSMLSAYNDGNHFLWSKGTTPL